MLDIKRGEAKVVRLVDCEVYAVDKSEITRISLLSFFCDKHTDDFVAVYSQGRYQLFIFIE